MHVLTGDPAQSEHWNLHRGGRARQLSQPSRGYVRRLRQRRENRTEDHVIRAFLLGGADFVDAMTGHTD